MLPLSLAAPPTPGELSILLVGNAGVLLSDGETSLLVDLPYEPGAYGYDRYDPATLRPRGRVVSVITHHHRDHFAASLFLPNRSWQLVGPPSVTASIPPGRVLLGDSLSVGAFSIIALPTPHTPDHRSYRIRWHDRILHFAGDTEEAASVLSATRLDVLFVTPWLQCALDRERRTVRWDRAILYHLQVGGGDRICGTTEALAQGASFTLSPRRVPPPP